MAEKRILDEETRKALQGYVPFSIDCTSNYTPEEYNPLDESLRPIFTLRPLNQSEMIQLKKNSMGYSTTSTPEQINKIADDNMDLIRKCVKSWINLFDAGTGQEIDYLPDQTGGCLKELFSQLPVWVIRSLTEYVKRISGLSMADDLGLK
jgi:hypothetical protein